MRLVCLWWANQSKDWLSMGLQTSTTAPKLTTTQPDGVDRLAAAPGLVKAGVLENHTSRDLSGHDSFCVASKQTKNKVLVKTERKKICLLRSLHAAGVTAVRALSEYASKPLSGWKFQAGCAVEPALFP